jgi:hypothetical protein
MSPYAVKWHQKVPWEINELDYFGFAYCDISGKSRVSQSPRGYSTRTYKPDISLGKLVAVASALA